MTTIDVSDFLAYSQQDFLDYFIEQDPRVLDIVVPKQLDKENQDLISEDYTRAAFIGQKLNDISSLFMFAIPPPDESEPFSFVIVTEKWEELSYILYRIVEVYTCNSEEAIAFDEEALSYVSNCTNDDDIACKPFIQIINNL